MANSYYKPCKELDRCQKADQYWEKDMKKWFEEYFAIAEETSYALAECQVGFAYLEDIGTGKDLAKACIGQLVPHNTEIEMVSVIWFGFMKKVCVVKKI